MLKTRLNSCQDQPMAESWHSFYQQQQQEEVVTQNPGSQQQQQQQQQAPPGDQQQQQQQQQQQVKSPFEGINRDNLDEASRKTIEAAELQWVETQKNLAAEKERADKMTQYARLNQSEKDKLLDVVRRHNLPIDGVNKVVNTKSPEEEQEEQLITVYKKELGLNDQQAAAYAKIFRTGMKALKPGILQEVGSVLGPAVTNLSQIQADRFLTTIAGKPEGATALRLPGVLDASREIVNTMIATRQPITEASVEAAVNMAVGQVMMKSGGNLQQLLNGQQQQQQQQQQSSNLMQILYGGAQGGAGNFVPFNQNGGGGNGPVPANDDTAKAAAAVAAMMDRQIKK